MEGKLRGSQENKKAGVLTTVHAHILRALFSPRSHLDFTKLWVWEIMDSALSKNDSAERKRKYELQAGDTPGI